MQPVQILLAQIGSGEGGRGDHLVLSGFPPYRIDRTPVLQKVSSFVNQETYSDLLHGDPPHP